MPEDALLGRPQDGLYVTFACPLRGDEVRALRELRCQFPDGVIAAEGHASIEPLLLRLQADETIPALALELFAEHAKEYAQLNAQLAALDAKLLSWRRAYETSRDPRHWSGDRFVVGDEDARRAGLPVWPAICRLARSDAEGSFHGGQDQARHHHAGRRRDFAQPAAGKWDIEGEDLGQFAPSTCYS
jgi:hypothetical protein